MIRCNSLEPCMFYMEHRHKCPFTNMRYPSGHRGCAEHHVYDPKNYADIECSDESTKVYKSGYKFVDDMQFKKIASSGELTAAHIAERTGIDVNYVRVLCRKHGYKPKPVGLAIPIEKIRKLAERDMLVSEIAAYLKCSYSNVSRRAKRAGIAVRKG